MILTWIYEGLFVSIHGAALFGKGDFRLQIPLGDFSWVSVPSSKYSSLGQVDK